MEFLKKTLRNWTEPEKCAHSNDDSNETFTNQLWNEDFSHRPSWCDAKLALEQIRRGKAKGNKPALYFRAFLQTCLFSWGHFVQKRSIEVLFIGLVVLCLFSIGLRDAVIITDIDKLWVQKHGRLHNEREFVKHAFESQMDYTLKHEGHTLSEAVISGLSNESAMTEEIVAKIGQEQFLVLIQTVKKKGAVIGKEDFLLHEETMSSIAQLKIRLFNQTWALSDVCFKPAAPSLPEVLKPLFGDFLDKFIPCVMITPLDCFWDGAKPNGPFPPFQLKALEDVLDSLPGSTVSWKNFNPIAVLDEAIDLIALPTLDTIKSLYKRAGITQGYLNRPCLEPLEAECPKQAPNYVDVCSVVEKFLAYNEQHDDLYDLRKYTVVTTSVNHLAEQNFNINETLEILGVESQGSDLSSLISHHDDPLSENYGNSSTGHHHHHHHHHVGHLRHKNHSSANDDFSAAAKPFGDEDSSETAGSSNTPGDKMCANEILASKVRQILLNDKNLYEAFVPAWSKIDFAKKLTASCNGFAENFMRWPEDLIIGGIKRDKDKILSFEALESVFMLASPQDIFQRMKPAKMADLDRPWTLELANDVLNAWQRNFADYVYKHKNNSRDSRILHPLAGTSVNDMLEEFSKFNPTVIIIGYVFMIVYASVSLCSFADRGVRSSVGLGFAGCLLVTLSGVAGLGCSMILDVPFNAATTQIVPFLTLGLGVDDMFLLVHSYREIVRLAKKDEIGFLLKETGLSALLTSINNVVAFLAGGFLPVPALRDFCLQVAILLTFNAVSILTIYPAIMSIDLWRRKNRRVDLLCCLKVGINKMVVTPVNPPSWCKGAPYAPSTNNYLSSYTEKSRALSISTTSVQAINKEERMASAGDSRQFYINNSYAAAHPVGADIINADVPLNTSSKNANITGLLNNVKDESKIISRQENSSCNLAKGDSNATLSNLDDINALSSSQNCLTLPIDSASLKNGTSSGDGIITITSANNSKAHILSKSGFQTGCSLKHWTLHRFVSDCYNVWLSRTPVKVFVVLFNLVVLALGIFECSKVELGLELTDVIPKGTAAYAFLEARQDYFSFYPFNAIIQGPIDLPSKQALIYAYREKLSDISYVVKRDGKVREQFWLDLMRIWLTDLQKHFDENVAQGKLLIHVNNNTGYGPEASEESILAYKLLCNAGKTLNCTRAKTVRLVDKENGIINKDGFYNYLSAWVTQDPMTYHVSQAAMSPKPYDWSFSADMSSPKNMTVPMADNLIFSRMPFFSSGLEDTPKIVDMIQQTRAICDEFSAKGLPNFPDGLPFTFWEQYLHLRYNLVVALSIVIGSVFVVVSILLVNPWTSAVVVSVLVVLVVELAGFMGAVGLKLNAVSAVSLITAVGIGVEFTVHISLSYLTSLGSRNERMASTLNHMFIPVLHGGLSTLLGVIMLAFSEFEFIVRYFFMVMSALIVLGILNGLLFLPVLLSLVGPNSEVRTIDGSHYLPPPSPIPSRKLQNRQESQGF